MISLKDSVLEGLKNYRTSHELSEVDSIILSFLEKGYHYPLKDFLEEREEVLLNPNGEIFLGMPFDNLIGYLNNNPYSEKTGREVVNVFEDPWRFSKIENSKNGYVCEFNPEEDITINKFICGISNLGIGSIKSVIVEPGYGLRIDTNGQIGNLIEKILTDNIPTFIDGVNIRPNDKSRSNQIENNVFLYHGFEIN